MDGTGGKPRLVCHLSWTRYPPSACKSTVKACKSFIIVTSVLLGTPDAGCTFPTLHKFQWCETTTYNLNRPFEYEVNVHTFCQHIVDSREGSLDKPMHNRSDAHYACWFCISMACSPAKPSQTAPHKDACHAGDSFLLMPMERHCIDGLVDARPTIIDWQSVGFSNILASISCRMGARYLCRSVHTSKLRTYFAGTMVW